MLQPADLPYTMATGEAAGRHHAVGDARGRLAAASTTRRFAPPSRGAGGGPLSWAWASARSSNRRRTVRASTSRPAFPAPGTRRAWVRIEPSGVGERFRRPHGTGGRAMKPRSPRRWPKASVSHPSSVRIDLGNTDIAPYGMGSRGARACTAGGGALYLCARNARRPGARDCRRSCWSCPIAPRLRLVDARVSAGSATTGSTPGLTLADVARRAYLDPTSLPQGVTPGLDFSLTYDPPPMTYSNSTHGCEIELDWKPARSTLQRYRGRRRLRHACSIPSWCAGQQQGAIAMG